MDGDENTTQQESQANGKAYTFLSSYAHAIDDKGRIIVPSAYRNPLGPTFTIGPTRDFQGIALYPNAVFDQLLADIMSMNQRKPIVQRFAMQFSKLSYRDMQADGQGRLLLPAKIRQRMLGDAKELEISGAFDHVRIMDSAKAAAEDTFFGENRDEILEQFGNLDE